MLFKLACDPDFSRLVLQKMMHTAKSFALAQIEAGADVMGVGDAICSQISPKMYSEYVKPLHDDLFRFIQKQDTMVKLHICGNIKHLLSHLAELTPDIIDLDWMVNMEDAYKILDSGIIRCGNIDPVVVIETQSPEKIFNTTSSLIRAEQGRPFILSGGCEITPLTPVENLKAMKDAARSSSSRN